MPTACVCARWGTCLPCLQVMYAALSRGLSFKTTMSNIITLVPPLTITEAELDRVFEILDDSIGALGNAAHLKP